MYLLLIVLMISIFSWIDLFLDFKKNPLIIKEYNLKNDDIETIKEIISDMTGREFELFCTYLFKRSNKYKNVELTQATHDEGKDIILTTFDDEIIYVENKRYTDKASSTEEFMIGREICQKFIGSMVSDNIKKGIIMTTGNIHQNAWNYINKIENNTDIKIDILNMNDILQMVREYCDSEVYKEIAIEQGVIA